MARIRTIKPAFWKHEELSELPAETHMLAAALLNYADDEGYFNANPKLVAAECCPLRDDSVSVHEQLTQLENIGYIRRATGSDGKTYGHVVTFLEHQRINRPNPSEIKGLVKFSDDSLSAHTQVTPGREKEKEKEKEGKGKARERAPAPKGTRFDLESLPDDWRAFANEFEDCDAVTEFERFGNYWRAKSGKDATKVDWFATWRNWILRDHKRKTAPEPQSSEPPPDPNHGRVWAAIGPANYTAWIASRAREVTDSEIIIETDFHRSYVQEKFGDNLRKAGFEVTDGMKIPDFLRRTA